MAESGTTQEFTAKEQKFIEAFVSMSFHATNESVFESLDMPPRTGYRYLNKLQDEINRRIKAHWASRIGQVRKAHMNQCLEGDMTAIRLFYEMAGEYIPNQKIDMQATIREDEVIVE